MSTAGGLHRAFEHAAAARCTALQVFVKNQRQWMAPPLADDHVRAWRQAARAAALGPILAHGSYLINPASPDAGSRRRSVRAIVDELQRCARLGVRYLVIHPGAYLDATPAAGIRRIVRSLDEVHELTTGLRTRVVLETTAGQGTALGHRFEHLRDIFAGVRYPRRLGVCVDTCHVFAAGYDLRTPETYAATMAELDRVVGFRRVKCLHLNDSQKPLGSRVDRHAHIGDGHIGRRGFRILMRDARFRGLPMVIETPKGTRSDGRDLDRANLQLLRRMAIP